MTKVTNENGTFYIPDEITNDDTKTVAELNAVAIPYGLYLLQEQKARLEQDLENLNNQPDEVLVPNQEKERIPEIEQEIERLQEKINNL